MASLEIQLRKQILSWNMGHHRTKWDSLTKPCSIARGLGSTKLIYPLAIWHRYSKWPIYSWFTHETWIFSTIMLIYQRVNFHFPMVFGWFSHLSYGFPMGTAGNQTVSPHHWVDVWTPPKPRLTHLPQESLGETTAVEVPAPPDVLNGKRTSTCVKMF